ncbi:MlaC/ttg2D family ABC transporter substrate-binding protein [Rickettsia endosymbiont of Cardiosporidium cionae]|uniref:MlaC/ttg2D family ABC transporter substrate-binding protein n=1 Tax=Rickettsia endosymbiont of Cardiosporidium cionae TaxID=2777155 RepID=UPI001893FBC7|nr:ABC transporter substrate-binding protein [Rickettsia endosymbiont of Cardiosporidium cionae]
MVHYIKIILKPFLVMFFAWSVANANDSEITSYVENLIKRGYVLFNNKQLTDQELILAIKDLVTENLDTEWIGIYVLGAHKRELSDDKVREFLDIYKKFMVIVYTELGSYYSGEMMNMKKVIKIGDNVFSVVTELFKPRRQASSPANIGVNYIVHQISGTNTYKIIDVVTDGVSIINSHRAEFNHVIFDKGIDFLINDLTKRIVKRQNLYQ